MAARILHPELTAAERRELLLAGIERFERGEYFDAHESWEEIWRSTTPQPRDLFQGLIQVSVGFHHHFARGRPDVARRVLAKGRRRLAPFLQQPCGLALAALVDGVRAWERWLAKPHGEPPAVPRLRVVDVDRLP